MKEVRDLIGQNSELKDEFNESLRQPVKLLNDHMRRLSLKDKNFQVFEPADKTKMEEIWHRCQSLDPNLKVGNVTRIMFMSRILFT